MFGGFLVKGTLLTKGSSAVAINSKIKLRLKQSRYLNFNNLIKAVVLTPQSPNIF
jgi:hypothetical protein